MTPNLCQMNVDERDDMEVIADLSDLKNIHLGQKCFVVGAGPSLDFQQIVLFQHQHVVISVNSSIMMMSWQYWNPNKDNSYWLSNDSLCMQWSYFKGYVITANCTKLIRTSWRKYYDQIEGQGFRFFAPRLSQNIPLESGDGGLCFGSSVLSAIDLALLMGCKQIYLLGVDQRMKDGKSHFWQFWPQFRQPVYYSKVANSPKRQQRAVFDLNVPVFKALREYAGRLGAVIKNCSEFSLLKEYEKVTLRTALLE